MCGARNETSAEVQQQHPYARKSEKNIAVKFEAQNSSRIQYLALMTQKHSPRHGICRWQGRECMKKYV